MEVATHNTLEARMKEYEPHRVFTKLAFPKTGGRLGKCYLLWGNELKHDYFPMIAMVGPDYPRIVIMLVLPALVLFCFFGCMSVYDTWKLWAVIVSVVMFILNEICILITTMSNPGIIFRGTQEYNENGKLICSRDNFL